MDQRWDDRDLEQGWCSHCVRRTEHKLKEKTWLPGLWRSIYECKGCKKRTVPCINDCGAAAKGDWHWDDHFCLQCEGTIVSWPYPGGPWHETQGGVPPRAQARNNRTARGGGRTQENLPSAEDALRGAQSSLEVLRDCLDASTEDNDMLRQVSNAAQRDRDLLQKLVERTEDETKLAQLLETHTELVVVLDSYKTLYPPSSGGAAPAGSAAAALAAAENRLASNAARGRPAARIGQPTTPTAGEPGTPVGADPQAAAAAAASLTAGWSAEAREAFRGKMEQSLADQAAAPSLKPYPVSAPQVNWKDGAEQRDMGAAR